MNLYVGNLPYQLTDEELRAAFEPFGTVTDAKIIKDRETQRSRGFGFVTMGSSEEGQAAIDGVKELKGRELRINEARPRE